MNTLVVDFDDVDLLSGPSANGMNWIYYLKGKFPNFKCTLFTIPGRSNWGWLLMLNQIPWIQLALHGWNHIEGELITQEMFDKWPYQKIYKGPNWNVSLNDLGLLLRNNYILAVKDRMDFPVQQWSLTDPLCFHGHVWIEGDWKRLEEKIDKNTKFEFIS